MGENLVRNAETLYVKSLSPPGIRPNSRKPFLLVSHCSSSTLQLFEPELLQSYGVINPGFISYR